MPSFTRIQLVGSKCKTNGNTAQKRENAHEILVPPSVTQFVRRVLSRNSYSADDPGTPAATSRRQILLKVLRQTDPSGSSLLDQAARIGTSVQSTRAMFRSQAPNSKTPNAEDANFIQFVKTSMTTGKGSVEESRDVLSGRIESLETALVALLSNEEEMPAEMVTEVCGQSIAVCAIASWCLTSPSDLPLRGRCLRLLARLLTFPVTRVRRAIYEQILSVITTKKLKGIGFATIEVPGPLIDQHIMLGVLLNTSILGIVLAHGTHSPETQACAVGVAHQLKSLILKEQAPAGSLELFMPLLDALPVSEGPTRAHLSKCLTKRAHILLELQRLGSKSQAIRIEAARYLRMQANLDGIVKSATSLGSLSTNERIIDVGPDPRILRDPILYTSEDVLSVSLLQPADDEDFRSIDLSFAGISKRNASPAAPGYLREDVQKLGNLLNRGLRWNVSDVEVSKGDFDFPVWCAAAIHLTSMLVQKGESLAIDCGAHRKGKENKFQQTNT